MEKDKEEKPKKELTKIEEIMNTPLKDFIIDTDKCYEQSRDWDFD